MTPAVPHRAPSAAAAVRAVPGGRGGRFRRALRRLADGHDQLFLSKWRSGLQREARRQEDDFLALLLLSSYGIDDPAAFHTLPLTAEMVEAFHRWHQREGHDRFPTTGVCC
ncbi:cory-CC-star protein [Egicoccus sp. AB-alg6-2]|uniref:cory-CC-star protein n=1 Tax=Egicoccus sp. AB-alg6-2 TaxID=3242692 RepID=UPI00359EC819